MNAEDYRAEYTYRIAERLGIACGIREPTDAEMEQARAEVARDMDRLEQQENYEQAH